MAIISNGVTVASGGSVTLSTSAVLTATASASVGSVGSYAMMRNENFADYFAGYTVSGGLAYSSGSGTYYSGNISGTWRVMGQAQDSGASGDGKASVMLRIS